MRTETLSPLFEATAFDSHISKSATKTARRRNALLRLVDAMVAARLKAVEGTIHRRLAHHSDQDLKSLGWTEQDIARLRRSTARAA